MPVTTRASSKRFNSELNKALADMNSIKKVGLKKLNAIITKLNCDGHTVRSIDHWVEAGMKRATIEPYASEYQFDSYRDKATGEWVDEPKVILGVYDLDMLRIIALVYELKYEPAIGRGTQAERIREAIEQAIA